MKVWAEDQPAETSRPEALLCRKDLEGRWAAAETGGGR